jgi:hypothetical protein
MRAAIRFPLLEDAIIWVLHCHQKASERRRSERPMHAPLAHTFAELVEILQEFRMDLHKHKLRERQGLKTEVDYIALRRTFIEKKQRERGWHAATANLYSSVISTYVNWERSGIADKKKRAIIESLRPGYRLFSQFWPGESAADASASQMELRL